LTKNKTVILVQEHVFAYSIVIS